MSVTYQRNGTVVTVSDADYATLNPPGPAPTLADTQATKIAALTDACSAQIVGGFTSSALGSSHTYPSKIPIDQINLMGSVTASLLPGLSVDWTTPFWCADSSGAWAFVAHTAAQIQQAGSDGKSAVAGAQAKLATLSAEVMAATTLDAVNAINW